MATYTQHIYVRLITLHSIYIMHSYCLLSCFPLGHLSKLHTVGKNISNMKSIQAKNEDEGPVSMRHSFQIWFIYLGKHDVLLFSAKNLAVCLEV